jgi:histidyl-tRNA synthetase
MSIKISAIKGVKDILPEEVRKWQRIENESRSILENHGYQEIRVPAFEFTELFARSIGQGTDIVEKEMYTFQDSKGAKISLRPEGTAGVVRACIENHLLQPAAVNKLYYMGPMFRHERPQKGRYRQFYQIGAEALGTENPLVDAEVLSMLHLLFQRIGISDTSLELNSLGCKECRPGYRTALQEFLRTRSGVLCGDCKRRTELNPLRVLDCKVPSCKEVTRNAPSVLSSLCGTCMDHFESVKSTLDELGVPFEINERLVRGLDYYTRTTFEIVTDKLGAQNAVAAGGRYDGLVEELGGPPTPGIGFALGIERLVALLPENNGPPETKTLYLAPLGTAAMGRIPKLLHQLRSRGLRVETDYQGKSLKSQMKRADKLHADYVGILGEEELNQGMILLRDMQTKDQRSIPLDDFVALITKTMSRNYS